MTKLYKIKPLEWVKGPFSYHTEGFRGIYKLVPENDGFSVLFNTSYIPPYGHVLSLGDAKGVAQRHHENQVGKYLEEVGQEHDAPLLLTRCKELEAQNAELYRMLETIAIQKTRSEHEDDEHDNDDFAEAYDLIIEDVRTTLEKTKVDGSGE